MQMQWMILPYKRMLDFNGRSRRLEYWMFHVLLIAQIALIMGLIVAFAPRDGGALPWSHPVTLLLTLLAMIAAVGWFWAGLALSVRRFHDQDKSGWYVLLGAIPYVGGLITLVFMCLPGTAGPNRFGPDPINPDLTDVFG
ncbi:membrane protein [Novosphingobium pokkalii]|nr:membrane protein [Novosphingobium pokkalii]